MDELIKVKKRNQTTYTCRFELHIINDEVYTDYALGNNLSDTILPSGYDMFDDIIENVQNIAEKLYKECFGQFTYIIEIDLTYVSTYDYFNGYDEDLKYEYRIIDRYESSYFNEEED